MRQWTRMVVAALALAGLAAGAAGQATAPGVDDLLAKYFAARGGLEKLKGMTTMRMTGRVEAGGQQMEMVIVSKRPNLMRQEMTVMGQKIVTAFDGTRVWAINPLTGSSTPQVMPGPQAQTMKEQADFDGPLVDYRAKGNKIERVGTDKVDGRETVKLKVTVKGGGVVTLDIDAATFLEVRLTREVDVSGTSTRIETLMSDFRDVSGLMMPHTVRTLLNGQQQAQMTISRIEVNPAVDDTLFAMPPR